MANQNIQALFATIRVEQIMTYMTLKKWRVSASSDRLDFESKDAEGETQRLFMPAQQSHPRYRRLLPNLIFSLAVIEQREAIDVANDIADIAVSNLATTNAAGSSSTSSPALISAGPGDASSTPTQLAASVELMFQNSSEVVAAIYCLSGQIIRLQPQETIGVTLSGIDGRHLIQFSDQLHFSAINGKEVQFWWPQLSLPPGVSDREWISELLLKWSAENGHDGEALDERLKTALDRFEFSLPNVLDVAARAAQWSLASAILLSEAIHAFDDSSASRGHAYELARRLAALAGRSLLVDDGSTDALWLAARSESTAAPTSTHKWLCASTQSGPVRHA